MKTILSLLFLFLFAFDLFAVSDSDVTDYHWVGSPNSLWTDSVWSQTVGGRPIADFYPGVGLHERAYFSGTSYVNIPAGDFATRALFRVNLTGAGNVFTLNGLNGVFRIAASEEDNYTAEPFQFLFSGQHFFNLQLHTVAAESRYKRALLTVTNALLTASRPDADSMYIDFKNGFWNFYDPVPDQIPSKGVCLVAFNRDQRYARAFVDGKGASMRFSSLYIRGNSLSNDFIFADGRHEIMGDLHFPHDNCSRRATETRFTVTSNALLRVDGQTRFGYVSEYYDTSNRVFKVLAEKGGEIRFKGQLFNYDVCRINIGARDNGSLVFGDGANTVHYLGGVNLVTAKVEVVDSKLELVDTFVLGGKYNNAIIGNELSFAGMHFSNAVVRTGIGEGGTRRLYVANGEIESIDSDWESRNLYLGYKNGISKLAIKSGRFNQLGEFKIGCEAGGKAELSFEGGESTIAPPEKGASYFGWTLGSESVMRISGGKLKFVIPASDSFFIGYGTSATATVYQTGGEFLVKGEGGLIVGSDGVGNYEMQGGTLTADQIRLGYGSHKRGVQIFRQTGGFADIRSTDIWHGVNVCDSPSNCKLVLDGGVMQCNSIRGWNGSTSKGKDGWAVLEADGGTLRASQKSEVQIENFDEAKLGTNGLTVESVFDITIKQGFTDQEDELGVLALTGSGVKTLTATNSTQSRLTATGGLVKFAPTAGVNARHYSAASFAGGSGLSLEGNQSEAVFSSLSLGDETSFAVIKLDVGDVVRSDSAIENLTRVKVSLSGTLAAGKYVLVRCKGAVQDEVRNNWILESELLSSKPAGCGALFSVDYDNALDETLFAVEFVPYSDEIPSNILSGDLQISDLVSVDAVHFNSSDSKKIEGEGALIIADSILDALRVDGGHHEIASKLSLPCGMMAEAVIAKDASLDISGVILRGGLRKSGLGLLELSAHNMFGIGFVQDGGTSVLKYGDSAGNGSITVSDGTLVFDGEQDEMRLATPLKIAPSIAPTNAVVLKADRDTVINMVSAASGRGAMFKRGAGKLTVEEGQSLSMVNSSGFSKINQQYASNLELVFPEDGSAPAQFPYSGLNVVEGELRLKGVHEQPCKQDSINSFKSLVSMTVGLNLRNVAAPPGVVIDHAICNFNVGSRHFNVGSGLSDAVYGDGGNPYLILTNNSSLIVNTLNFAWDSRHTSVKPRLEVDSSTLTCSYMFQPNRGELVALEHVFRRGSALFANITFETEATLLFDDSIYAKDASLNPGKVIEEWGNNRNAFAKGTMAFVNGSKFHCNQMCVSHNQNYPASYPFTVKFDNGEWIPAKTNFVCSGSIVGDPAKIIIESVGEGLVMAPGDGIEWLLDMPVIGTGGLVKRGDGTLALVQSAMLYSGVTKVEGGVLSLNDATLSDAVLAGGGTVDNGVLYEATLKVNVSDEYEVDQTLMLGNSLSVSGSLRIDLGRTHENPLPLPFARFPVARYDVGGTPPVSGECRIINGGYKSMRGKIECEQGVVYVTPRLVGFSIIIR